MAICNRDKGTNEQRQVVHFNVGALATGVTREVWVAPWPFTIEAVYYYAQGLSGAATVSLQTSRWVAGGATVYTAFAPDQATQAYSTSGLVGLSLVASGSTLLNGMAKDCIELVSATADTAHADLCLAIQVKRTQDVLSFF